MFLRIDVGIKGKHVRDTGSSSRFLEIVAAEIIWHYDDVIMGTIASQITSLTSIYSTVYSDADQSKHQSSASLAFVCGIHRGPVNSPHKWPVTRKMFPFDDVIMGSRTSLVRWYIIGTFAEISNTTILGWNNTLKWRHNGCVDDSNHQLHDCLLNHLFRHRWKKTSKLRVTGLCVGNSTTTAHKWPVTRKMFPFDGVMMSKLDFVSPWHNVC